MTYLQRTATPQFNPLHDWLTFVSSVIGALAWPLAVVLLALVFRVALRSLVTAFGERIGQLTGIKLPGGIEASWPEALQHIAGELNKTEKPSEREGPDERPAQANDLLRDEEVGTSGTSETRAEPAPVRPANPAEIALVSPPSAVIAAFLPVERAIHEYLRAAGEAVGGSPVRSFTRSSLVPASLKRAVGELSTLRNRAAHEPELALSARDAIEYSDAATRAVSQINRATDQLLST